MLGVDSGGGGGGGGGGRGSGLAGQEALPAWVREGEEPDPKLRDERGERVEYGERRVVPAGEKLERVVRAKVVAVGKERTLDNWLEEEEEEGSEEESGSTESESGSESEEEEEESEDEGEKGRLVR